MKKHLVGIRISEELMRGYFKFPIDWFMLSARFDGRTRALELTFRPKDAEWIAELSEPEFVDSWEGMPE
jgi:hypothetical protein